MALEYLREYRTYFHLGRSYGLSESACYRACRVTMRLVMNEHGFFNRTSILPRNASEPKTLQEMIENLSVHQDLLKPIIILDAEVATRDNLTWLREKGYAYVVSARQDAPSLDLKVHKIIL
ncbi:MAG: transposase family protein [Parachlamydiaceae bacterium]|nr:transposase family protein [Parachlamydiaceae bacterium]